MRCLVVYRALLDRACERDPVAGQSACEFEETSFPADWTAAEFDESAWPAAIEYYAREVDPKDGCDQITWDPSA